MKRISLVLGLVAVVAAGIGFIQVKTHQQSVAVRVGSIVDADKNGRDVTGKERALRDYINQHMHTKATYVLEGSYQRAVDEAQMNANPPANGQIYAQAQAACGGRADSITQARCVQAYLGSHTTPAANPKSVVMPARQTYTKHFIAPGWTADTSGVAFLTALVAAVLSVYIAIMRRI